MRKYAVSSLILIAADPVLPALSHAQTRDIGVHGEMLDRIAAIVNDGLVLKSELDAQMDAVTKRLQEQKVELPSQSVLQTAGSRSTDPAGNPGAARQAGRIDRFRRTTEQRAAGDRKPQQDPLRPAAHGARRAGRRLQAVSRRYAQGTDLEHPAPARRDRAHQCDARTSSSSSSRASRTSAANDEFNVSHILLSLPEAATPQQLEEITHKAQDLAARAAEGRGLRPARHREFQQPNRAGRRPAGLAQGHPAAAVHFGSGHQDEAGRGQRTGAHPERLSHREAQRAAQRRGAGHHQSDPRAAHPDEDQRAG